LYPYALIQSDLLRTLCQFKKTADPAMMWSYSIMTIGILLLQSLYDALCSNLLSVEQPQRLRGRSFEETRLLESNPTQDKDQQRRLEGDLSELERKWYISKPTFAYHGYEFDLDYKISENIGDAQISYKVYDGIDCSKDSNEVTDNNEYLFSTLLLKPDEIESSGNNTSLQDKKLKIRIDTDKIRFTPLYADYGSFSQIYFCVRFSAFHQEEGSDKRIEVNWVETPVLLVMEALSFSVGGGGGFSNAYPVYESRTVDVHLCNTNSDTNSSEAVQRSSGTPGQLVRVCIQPGNQTLTEGGNVWFIEEFTFNRENHTQPVIEAASGGSPSSDLTVVTCEPGSDLCYFETVLGDEFFDSLGIVEGTGTAFLEFGSSDTKLSGEYAIKEQAPSVKSAPTKISFKIVALPPQDESAAGFLEPSSLATIGTMIATLCFFL
jgi:hypothetical protein